MSARLSLSPSPEVAAAPSAPSRRALLAGALGGLGVALAGVIGRAAPTRAAVGDNLKAGSIVGSGGQSSGVQNNSSSNGTWVVTQNGTGTAIRGQANSGTAGRFTSKAANKYALEATNSSPSHGSGAAIHADGQQNDGIQATGYLHGGEFTATSAGGDAVLAQGGYNAGRFETDVANGNGLSAYVSGTGSTWGLDSSVAGSSGVGVNAIASHSTGVTYGIYASVASPNGYAGYFSGDVHVAGDLTYPAIIGQVDDPVSPTQRWLQHVGVESIEQVRINSGTVRLNGQGEATVRLPAWYAAIHADHRYQLTAIGTAAPSLHVATKLDVDGRFTIAGGSPNAEVSWQLTGIRDDPYARAHPVATLREKTPDRIGTYSHPELYGAPASLRHDAKMRVKG